MQQVNAIITKTKLGKFACFIEGKLISLSKHQDYFTFHYHRHDIKKLNAFDIRRFVYVAENGEISFAVDANDKLRNSKLKQDIAAALAH